MDILRKQSDCAVSMVESDVPSVQISVMDWFMVLWGHEHRVAFRFSKSRRLSRRLDDLFGKSLLLWIVAAELDPRTEKPSIRTFAKRGRDVDGDTHYEANFVIPEDFGGVGAVSVENEHQKEIYVKNIVIDGFPYGKVNITCNSWVHTKFDNPEKRIFFTNKSYIPSQTPSGLKRLREKELVTVRGDGFGERIKFERIYDYDVYNDIGDPDGNGDGKRPVLGGKELPYPRRFRALSLGTCCLGFGTIGSVVWKLVDTFDNMQWELLISDTKLSQNSGTRDFSHLIVHSSSYKGSPNPLLRFGTYFSRIGIVCKTSSQRSKYADRDNCLIVQHPLSESRSNSVYVPRDETFSEEKSLTFSSNAVYSVLQAVVPVLELVDRNHEYLHFPSTGSQFNVNVDIPRLGNKKNGKFNFIPTLIKAMSDIQKDVMLPETPQLLQRDKFSWFRDVEFARQTLASFNPYSIRLVKPQFCNVEGAILHAYAWSDLYGHIDGSIPSPSRTITTGTAPSVNPAFTLWFRQDQLIQNALMTSADPIITTTITTATSAKTAWDALHIAYANNGLGPEFCEISGAIRARDSTTTYKELYEKLLDHELFLRHEESKKVSNQITAAVAATSAATFNKPGHVASVCRSKSHNHFEAQANYVSGLWASENPWILDSSASHHITAKSQNLQPYNGMEQVSMADDGGGEYKSLDLYLRSQGIEHLLSPPYTPQRVALAERRHRHIIETARTLLHESSLPPTL
ncbi:Linoleate 13S-lipoxygenase 2-1, chloroplastic [Capsicum annuum]|nr:Linoleate 13S-lipoxygenase 2-1, chloroplastic [Capsicum annuum]KAF3667480.1 Linoleate 13S-lipoxygenase 2-1, chloroplastic [Capsicum annuum]